MVNKFAQKKELYTTFPNFVFLFLNHRIKE